MIVSDTTYINRKQGATKRWPEKSLQQQFQKNIPQESAGYCSLLNLTKIKQAQELPFLQRRRVWVPS